VYTFKNLYKYAVGPAVVTFFLLLVPLVAMQISNEVAWNLPDFVVAGSFLFVTGFTYRLVTRKANNNAYRIAVALALGTALLLIWVNLAVGLTGPENDLANLVYFAVLVIGITGAIIVRFQPSGMARALFATALAQTLVAVIALSTGVAQYPGSSVSEILAVNSFFVVLWIGSALLFHYAARR
jgi:hypothetical protein